MSFVCLERQQNVSETTFACYECPEDVLKTSFVCPQNVPYFLEGYVGGGVATKTNATPSYCTRMELQAPKSMLLCNVVESF